MSVPARFPFISRTGNPPLDLAPLLPARLARNSVTVDVVGLVDSGASVSVVPFDIGAQFGPAVDPRPGSAGLRVVRRKRGHWAKLPHGLTLGGVAGGTPAKLLPLELTFGPIGPVMLLFTWSASNAQPVIFGQTNFFHTFDVFFARARGFFEISQAAAPTP